MYISAECSNQSHRKWMASWMHSMFVRVLQEYPGFCVSLVRVPSTCVHPTWMAKLWSYAILNDPTTMNISVCTYIYIYIHTHVYVYVCIYIYIDAGILLNIDHVADDILTEIRLRLVVINQATISWDQANRPWLTGLWGWTKSCDVWYYPKQFYKLPI